MTVSKTVREGPTPSTPAMNNADSNIQRTFYNWVWGEGLPTSWLCVTDVPWIREDGEILFSRCDDGKLSFSWR